MGCHLVQDTVCLALHKAERTARVKIFILLEIVAVHASRVLVLVSPALPTVNSNAKYALRSLRCHHQTAIVSHQKHEKSDCVKEV